MNIRPEKPGDKPAVHEVNRLAFEREDEAKLVNELRDGGYARLSLVAEEDGKIIGHVLFGEVSADGVSKALALAPGFDAIFLLGEPGYYSRFGFSVEKAKSFDVPYPKEYFMALELTVGALEEAAGEITYPPPVERM